MTGRRRRDLFGSMSLADDLAVRADRGGWLDGPCLTTEEWLASLHEPPGDDGGGNYPPRAAAGAGPGQSEPFGVTAAPVPVDPMIERFRANCDAALAEFRRSTWELS